MRPTDFCHPNELTCTRTSRVPDSLSPLSRRGGPEDSKGPSSADRGTGRFTTSVDRFGGSSCSADLALLPHGLETSVGVFFPRR